MLNYAGKSGWLQPMLIRATFCVFLGCAPLEDSKGWGLFTPSPPCWTGNLWEWFVARAKWNVSQLPCMSKWALAEVRAPRQRFTPDLFVLHPLQAGRDYGVTAICAAVWRWIPCNSLPLTLVLGNSSCSKSHTTAVSPDPCSWLPKSVVLLVIFWHNQSLLLN